MVLISVKHVAAVAAGVLGAAWFALTPSTVSAAPDLKGIFERLDSNRDGGISAGEFSAAAPADRTFIAASRPLPAMDSRPLPAARSSGSPADVVVGPGGTSRPPSMGGAQPLIIEAEPRLVPLSGGRSPAVAAQNSGFAAHDSNGDGVISFPEFDEHYHRMLRIGFRQHDRNGDGLIDQRELSSMRKLLPAGKAAPDLDRLDRNKDGKISRDEFGS